MARTATVFTAEYRASGYISEEEALLRRTLEDFGAVRLRPLYLPAAGGSTELWLAVSFVGLNMLSGLIEHLTGRFFDEIAEGLLRFFRARAARDGVEPEMTLRLSYDDIDLEVGPVGEAELRHVPRLAARVRAALASGSLQRLPVTRIVVGMVHENDRWEEPHLWNRSQDGERFWGISLEGHRVVTHILDTQTGLLAQAPRSSDIPPQTTSRSAE